MSGLKDLWVYIRSPFFPESKEPVSWETVPILGKILLTNFGLSIGAYMLAQGLFDVTGTKGPSQSSELMPSFNVGRLFLIAIALPFLEELFFRSWLRRRWGVKYIFPWTAILSIWLLAAFLQVQIPPLLIGTTAIALIALQLWMSGNSEADGAIYVDRVFPFAFWTSALVFALLHLSNYEVDEIGMLGIIVVLPQFISGIVYGYIMARYGFWTSFICHGVWNGSLVLLSLTLP